MFRNSIRTRHHKSRDQSGRGKAVTWSCDCPWCIGNWFHYLVKQNTSMDQELMEFVNSANPLMSSETLTGNPETTAKYPLMISWRITGGKTIYTWQREDGSLYEESNGFRTEIRKAEASAV